MTLHTGVTSTPVGGDSATFVSAQPKEMGMTPTTNLLNGRDYTPAVSTDVRMTWARFSPEWANRIKQGVTPLPVASITTHYKPR